MHSWVGDKQQRAAYEKQLTEVALKASQEKERLRELVRWEAVISLLFALLTVKSVGMMGM